MQNNSGLVRLGVSVDDRFGEFATNEAPRLFRVAWRLTGDREAAQDLVQDTLLRTGLAWDRIERRNDPAALSRYVTVTLINCFRSDRRRAWRRREVTTDHFNEIYTSIADESTVIDATGAFLARLPQRQREAVLLRFYLDLSEQQTAEAMGCSLGTVKSHASRGLDRLRELMASHDELQTED